MSVERSRLEHVLESWHLAITDHQYEQLIRLADLLRDWNQRINLVAPSTLADVTQRHILDSLVLATAWPSQEPPESLADVGSGGGFPGLPLAVLWPQTKITLIESITKKTHFLQHVKDELGLSHVRIYPERVEILGQGSERECYELVTARAVAQLAVLAEYCLPLCQVNGWWFAPKGADVEAELVAAKQAIQTLGGRTEGVFDVQVPGEPLRSLVMVEKIRPSPRKYPRAVGIPAKTPL